jgi:hypothetical protein
MTPEQTETVERLRLFAMGHGFGHQVVNAGRDLLLFQMTVWQTGTVLSKLVLPDGSTW